MLSAKDLVTIIFPLDGRGSDFLNSVLQYYTVFLYNIFFYWKYVAHL